MSAHSNESRGAQPSNCSARTSACGWRPSSRKRTAIWSRSTGRSPSYGLYDVLRYCWGAPQPWRALLALRCPAAAVELAAAARQRDGQNGSRWRHPCCNRCLACSSAGGTPDNRRLIHPITHRAIALILILYKLSRPFAAWELLSYSSPRLAGLFACSTAALPAADPTSVPCESARHRRR